MPVKPLGQTPNPNPNLNRKGLCGCVKRGTCRLIHAHMPVTPLTLFYHPYLTRPLSPLFTHSPSPNTPLIPPLPLSPF